MKIKKYFIRRVSDVEVPPRFMKHAYFDFVQCRSVYVLFPFNFLVVLVWRLNVAWCEYQCKSTWIDKEIIRKNESYRPCSMSRIVKGTTYEDLLECICDNAIQYNIRDGVFDDYAVSASQHTRQILESLKIIDEKGRVVGNIPHSREEVIAHLERNNL